MARHDTWLERSPRSVFTPVGGASLPRAGRRGPAHSGVGPWARTGRFPFVGAFLVCAALQPAMAATPPRKPLPEGNAGIAAKHPGDRGIEKDPAVVFVEAFDAAAVDDLKSRWDGVKNPDIMTLSDDVPAGSGTKRSLLMTHVGGKGDGANLYRRLLPGYEKLHVRFYVKFDPDCGPIHHFFHVGGYNPPTRWAQGGAGTRPRGNERFTTGVEPFGNAWRWDFYSYWMEMRGSPPRGQTWGNSFLSDAAVKAERGKWVCAELMMKLNDVGDSNGEQALWIDGKLVGHLGKGFPKGKWTFDRFLKDQGGDAIRWNDAKGDRERFRVAEGGEPFEGFRWRNNEALKINFLWPLFYITKSPDGHVSKVWFDQIVAARDYIGPLAPAAAGKSKE
ncbi:MAG: hypothetical protein FJ290_22925 [Planctomycetes bacterium]|nr:hypothetical protein [Planctomycetota bacterium]